MSEFMINPWIEGQARSEVTDKCGQWLTKRILEKERSVESFLYVFYRYLYYGRVRGKNFIDFLLWKSFVPPPFDKHTFTTFKNECWMWMGMAHRKEMEGGIFALEREQKVWLEVSVQMLDGSIPGGPSWLKDVLYRPSEAVDREGGPWGQRYLWLATAVETVRQYPHKRDELDWTVLEE